MAVAVSVFLQFTAIYFPPLAPILDAAPPNKTDYLVIGISFILPIVIVEIVKALNRKLSSND